MKSRIDDFPNAYAAICWLRWCCRGLLLLLLPTLYLCLGSRNAGGPILIGWALLFGVCAILRILINLVCFVKYSLWTMYLVLLSLGGFIAIGVGFPGWGTVVAFQGVTLVLTITMFCVAMYEPANGKIFDPDFKYIPRTKEERQSKWQPPESQP